MSSTPLVSIIVPVYRVEKYLTRCLDSIVNQTYDNLEIILVDDGSPDNSGKICDYYAELDLRIKVIHKPNSGQSSARNAALDIANGEYIYFIDSDDYIKSNLIEDNIRIILEEESDMVAFNYYEIINGKTISRDYIRNKNCSREYFFLDATVVVWSKIYSASLWKDLRFPTEYRIYEDNFIAPILAVKAKKISINPNFYYYYDRSNETSVMTKENSTTYYIKFLSHLYSLTLCDKFFPSCKQQLIAKTFCDAFRAYNVDIIINYLDKEQKDKLHTFFNEYDNETSMLRAKERILLWGYKHCKLINRIKGWHYLKKHKK